MATSDNDPVHPYYRAILNAYAQSGRPYYHEVTPPEAREMLRTSLAAAPPQQGLPELTAVENDMVSSTGHDVPVRIYRPTGAALGIGLFFHAGGWVIGDLDTADALCRRLAAGAGCTIVSVDYRLAPEHPFPAALDDARAVLDWAATSGEPLVLIGESAGGNIAAACAIQARESGPALAGQFLAYPVTDHDFTTASYRELGERNYLLSGADMRWFWEQYCPPGIDRDDPLVSPLRIDSVEGLPPSLVFVAELDPLRDEGLAFATRLEAGGVEVQTRCDPGMLHGYLSAAGAVPLAAEAVAEAAGWLRARIRDASNA